MSQRNRKTLPVKDTGSNFFGGLLTFGSSDKRREEELQQATMTDEE